MSNNETTEILEVVTVNLRGSGSSKTVKIDGLSKIRHLKILRLEDMKCSGSLSHLSSELGYLTWDNYPFECLAQSFQPHKLVELTLIGSRIQRLWSGTKVLPNLKLLDLSRSFKLVEMPDVAEAPNLEWIVLEECIQLEKLSPSIGLLRKLTTLNLRGCKNLVSLPNSILGLNSLEYLSVYGCSKLFNNELLDEARNTKHLMKRCLVEGPIHSHSKSHLIKKMLLWPLGLLHSRTQRESVSYLLHSRTQIESFRYVLPSSFTLPCLRQLDLRWCNLVKIPDAIGKLSCLEQLNLEGNNFVTLPNLKDLFRLYYLNLQHCKRLKYLLDLPSQTHLPLNIYPYSFRYFGRFLYSLLNLEEYMAGLMMFNCPEIVEMERCTSMAISWMLQILQSWYNSNCRANIGSIIPGSEIPKWFNNKLVSMEDNSIIIDASPFVHDNNWVGVVCCAIFIDGNLNFPTAHFYRTKMIEDLRRDLVVDHSDHMCLFYFPSHQFRHNLNTIRDMIRLCKERMRWDHGIADCKVEKFGYRLINVQDLQLYSEDTL